LFYLSRGFYWRPTEELEAEAAGGRPTPFRGGPKAAQGRAAYDQHVSGLKSSTPLHNAQMWLAIAVAGQVRSTS